MFRFWPKTVTIVSLEFPTLSLTQNPFRFGRPGVECYCQHESGSAVIQLQFLINEVSVSHFPTLSVFCSTSCREPIPMELQEPVWIIQDEASRGLDDPLTQSLCCHKPSCPPKWAWRDPTEEADITIFSLECCPQSRPQGSLTLSCLVDCAS